MSFRWSKADDDATPSQSADPLASGSFDPHEDAAARSAAPLAGPGRVVVQFSGPLTREEQARFKAAHGLALQDYVPDYAYIERLQPGSIEKLRQDPRVRAVIAYRAEF